MVSRDTILAKLKANKPELIDLPQMDLNVFNENLNLIKEFIKKVEVVGGNVIEIDDDKEIIPYIDRTFTDSKVKFSTIENQSSFNTVDLEKLNKPHELEDLDILILESNLGVAENGAIWLTDANIPVRVLPFITKHLVLIISKENVVPYMHEAYNKISNQDSNYGIFISGPSKTADIEQSLVIGAHGALSLTVFLK
ncbi:MAG: LUD domain-containing protein [Algibacter sp.]